MPPGENQSPQFFIPVLHALGLLQCIVFFLLTTISDWHSNVGAILILLALASTLYFVAMYLSKIRAMKSGWYVVILWALVSRLVLALPVVQQQQLLSSDINRYLWEGQVVEQGISPYLNPPISETLTEVKQDNLELWHAVDHKQVPAIYPPAAQFLFTLLPESARGFRIVTALLDFLVVLLLARWLRELGKNLELLIAYAWLPLAIVETSASGHIEALFLPFVIGGLYLAHRSLFSYLAISLLTIATLVKFIAAVPTFFVGVAFLRDSTLGIRRKVGICLLPVVLTFALYLPFALKGLPYGSVATFAERWRFNGAGFQILEWMCSSFSVEHAHWIVKSCSAVFIFLLVGYLLLRRAPVIQSSVAVLLSIIVLSPVVYPWYLLWFASLLPFIKSTAIRYSLLCFACTSLLSYEVLQHPSIWRVPVPVLALEFLPIVLAGAFALKERRIG